MMDEFIKILRNAGLEPTGIEIAEMLILAACIPAPTAIRPVSADAEGRERGDGKADLGRMRDEASANAGAAAGAATPQSAPPGGLFTDSADEAAEAEGGIATVPFRAPKAPALPGAHKITRALRPLRRRYPSPRYFVLDEEKTIRRIADGGPASPVMTPASERWLDVALVFDQSLTMQLWRPTLAEVRRLFERCGIFRNVRSWHLATDGPAATLHAATGWQPSQSVHSWRELLDPARRTLIVVISDCHAESWHNGDAWRLLIDWGGQAPVALVQVLPERFWRSTTMTPVEATLRAARPGLVNSRLEIAPSWYGEFIRGGGLPLPVVTLDEWSIGPWARMVAGASDVSSFALVIPHLPARGAALPAKERTSPAPDEPRPSQERVKTFFIAWARRPNGSMPRAPEPKRHLLSVKILIPRSSIMAGIVRTERLPKEFIAEGRFPWGASALPMASVCTICTAMCGNGVPIGTMRSTMRNVKSREQLSIHRALEQARTASFAAAVGSATPSAAGRRTATSPTPATASATSASAS